MLWGIHSTGRPNDNNGDKNKNNNNNNSDKHSRDPTYCWTKRHVQGVWMDQGNLGFLAIFVFNFFSTIWSSVLSSPFLRLEIVSAIKWRIGIGWQGETQEYPNIQTKYVVIPILKAGLPLNPGNLQMVNSGQSSKFWLTAPPLHRWFKARPSLFMQSSPLIFFGSNLSKQELRPNKRENKICGCSLNMDMDMKSFRGKENRQNVNVHMDI